MWATILGLIGSLFPIVAKWLGVGTPDPESVGESAGEAKSEVKEDAGIIADIAAAQDAARVAVPDPSPSGLRNNPLGNFRG